MKKNYENNQLIISMTFLFLIISIILLINIFIKRYRTYTTIDSIVVSDNYVESIIKKEDLKLLKSSKYLYIDNKKSKYKIISVQRNVLKRNNTNYNEVIIKIKLKKTYKENDYIKLTIFNRKEKIINIFKSCWKED